MHFDLTNTYSPSNKIHNELSDNCIVRLFESVFGLWSVPPNWSGFFALFKKKNYEDGIKL